MTTTPSVQTLHQSPESYPEVFSPSRMEQSAKDFAFPCVKRGSAKKCDGSPWLQKGSECSFVSRGETPEILDHQSGLTPDRITYYSTPEGIIELNKKGISLAIDKRISLFFQQTILCYGMSNLTFSAKGADDQIGTSPAITLSGAIGTRVVLKREAAHSSTIPTLIAHAKDGSTPNGFVYLKGGSSYAQHNATIGMHECVNGADELIDGSGSDDKLRSAAVKILNKVAQGLDPVQATKEFIDELDSQVVRTSQLLKSKETPSIPDKRRLVLDKYHLKIERVRRAAQEHVFYDRLLGVIINPTDPHETPLREVIYKKRYDVIRLQEVIESRIGKKIEAVKGQMGARDRASLEYILLKEFSTTAERTILEKLFSKTAVIFESEYGNTGSQLKSFKTRIENLRQKPQYKTLIANLISDLKTDFIEASSAEFTFRAGVFKDLRTMVHHWSQVEFCENYEQSTALKVSQAWVSRMEQLSRLPPNSGQSNAYKTPIGQRRRYVSFDDALLCAKTFKVDAGIFFPGIFTSA